MNGYERISSALLGKKTDAIPVMLHNFLPAAKESGFTQKEYRSSAENIAASFIRAVETYQYDGILVDMDTVTTAGAVGVPVDFPEDNPARSHSGIIHSLSAVSSLKKVHIEDYRPITIWLEAVRKLVDYFGTDIYIRGNCDQNPFSLASSMRTPGLWMMDLCDEDNQEAVKELLSYCTDITCQFIRLMGETGAHMVSNGDSTAGPSMISPEMYRKFALPYEKQVVNFAHKLKLPYTLHICGDTTLILDDMVATGADALELDYKTDVIRVHDILREKGVAFIGNVDPSGVLALGTEDTVKETTQKLIALFSDTNRFILNAGCALPACTPSKNIHAFIACARAPR